MYLLSILAEWSLHDTFSLRAGLPDLEEAYHLHCFQSNSADNHARYTSSSFSILLWNAKNATVTLTITCNVFFSRVVTYFNETNIDLFYHRIAVKMLFDVLMKDSVPRHQPHCNGLAAMLFAEQNGQNGIIITLRNDKTATSIFWLELLLNSRFLLFRVDRYYGHLSVKERC